MSSSSRRLFFALWPNDEVRSQLEPLANQVVAAASGGRPTQPDNFHITLAYLGLVPPTSMNDLSSLAAGITAEPISIDLTHIEHWHKARVAVLVCAKPPSELMQLAQLLNTELVRRIAWKPDHMEYRPHVTLAKGVEQDSLPALDRTIRWRSEQFVLVESVRTASVATYQIIETWRFGGSHL